MAITYVAAVGIEPTLGTIIGITATTIATTIGGIATTIGAIAGTIVAGIAISLLGFRFVLNAGSLP